MSEEAKHVEGMAFVGITDPAGSGEISIVVKHPGGIVFGEKTSFACDFNIAVALPCRVPDRAPDITAANAARLVQCWNNHDDLLAELETLVAKVTEAGWHKNITESAVAAIIKARAEPRKDSTK